MDEFLKQINAPTTDHFATAIDDTEAGGAEFLRNTITAFEGSLTNMASMRVLPPGKLPAASVVVLSFNTPPPAGKALQWSGAALIGGANIAISVYR